MRFCRSMHVGIMVTKFTSDYYFLFSNQLIRLGLVYKFCNYGEFWNDLINLLDIAKRHVDDDLCIACGKHVRIYQRKR